MSDATYPPAEFTRDGATSTVRFVLRLDNPVREVWAALTEPDRLAQWLAPGAIDLALGGRARLDFGDSGAVIDSCVTALTPLRILEYSWSGPGEPLRPVRWSLAPIGPLTRLGLTLRLPANEDVARSAAGWAAHLVMLTAFLAGASMRFPVPAFQAARAAYGGQLSMLSAASEGTDADQPRTPPQLSAA